MKSKITRKLTLYFSATLLLFSILIGFVFMGLFKEHTMELFRSNLEERAVGIAENLMEFQEQENGAMGRGSGTGGYNVYLRFLDEIAMTDVWIVDEDLALIMEAKGNQQPYNYSDLPQDAEDVVKEVFQGETVFSEGFSTLLDVPTLTVGTPILMDGEVVGALLLHAPVNGMNETIGEGLRILSISILIALILSLFLSICFAIGFTKPLGKMKAHALHLADGDYSGKTGVRQKDEIGELAAAIDVLSDRLDLADKERKQLEQLRRDFVANISHELRTPVTVIRGSLEALHDEVITDSEEIKNYHHQMLDEAMFLQRLVDDLLALSRLQNPEFLIEKQELNIGEALTDAVRSAVQIGRSRNIEIKQEQDKETVSFWGDYGRLRQMFMIVLDNAVKFSPANDVVTVTLKDQTISIQDHGEGIPPADLPYIFDRFYKVKAADNKNGTGLGLAVAKEIADRHGITITVHNLENRGVEFRFGLE